MTADVETYLTTPQVLTELRSRPGCEKLTGHQLDRAKTALLTPTCSNPRYKVVLALMTPDDVDLLYACLRAKEVCRLSFAHTRLIMAQARMDGRDPYEALLRLVEIHESGALTNDDLAELGIEPITAA